MTFEEFLKEWRDGRDAITAHTSGSTGEAKEISLSKEFMKRSARRTNSFFSIDGHSRLHSCVGADFIGGKMMAVRSEIAGCEFTWETPTNRPLADLGRNEEITLLSVVPSQMLHILDHINDLPHVATFLIGGAPIQPELRKRIAEAGLNAYESYGMTETASHIALRKVNEEEGRFIPLSGISVGVDERECLVISFDTGERFITNDIAAIAADGSFTIEGRYDNVIITGGRKVNPESVERRISHLFKGEIMVTSEADEKWGRKVVLLIEEPHYPGGEQAIRDKLEELLSPWERPKRIILNSDIPHTPNGKIKRR